MEIDFDKAVRLVLIGHIASYLSGRSMSLGRRLSIVERLIEGPKSIKDLKELCNVKYLEAYNSIYTFYKLGLIRKKDDGKYYIVDDAVKIFKLLVGLYNVLRERFGGKKAIEYYSSIVQSPPKIAILFVVYSRDEIAEDEVYEHVRMILRKAMIRVSHIRFRSSIRPVISFASIRRYMYMLFSKHKLIEKDTKWRITETGKELIEIILKEVDKQDINTEILFTIPETVRISRPLIVSPRFRLRSIEDVRDNLDSMVSLGESIQRNIRTIIENAKKISEIIGLKKIGSMGELEKIASSSDVEKIDSLVGEILDSFNSLEEAYRNFLGDGSAFRDRIAGFVTDLWGKIRDFVNAFRDLKKTTSENIIPHIEKLIGYYNYVRELLSDEVKKQFLAKLLEETKKKAPEHMNKLLRMLLKELTDEKDILAEILAERI